MPDSSTRSDGGPVRYWYLRMKQGKSGGDFTSELWRAGRVGVLFGTWRLRHVIGAHGLVDAEKLTASAIRKVCEQPFERFNDSFLKQPRRFFFDVSVGDRVVVTFDNAVHIGVVGEGVFEDEVPRGAKKEFFKCRPIHSCKSFPLSELPSVYRLVTCIGQGTIQEIHRLAKAIEILDGSRNAGDVRSFTKTMSVEHFVSMLSPAQWEVICSEYLRDEIGFRLLLLQVGKTLPEVDLVGVDHQHRRVLAQCKNDGHPRQAAEIDGWVKNISKSSDDILFFFTRGGVKGEVRGACTVVDDKIIADWLRSKPEYLECLQSL